MARALARRAAARARGRDSAKCSEGPAARPLLEGLLRNFEHAADRTAARSERPLDVGSIRAELGLSNGILGLDLEDDSDLERPAPS